jgi:hypothetical protein
MRISPRLRQRVARQAGFRCGYCLIPQGLTGARLELDHIIPKAAAGTHREENLWLACVSCNRFKGAQTHARDPVSRRRVRLFDPRKQNWAIHFAWSPDGTQVIGLTPCGRATVQALKMNHLDLVSARRRWASVSWWPPPW